MAGAYESSSSVSFSGVSSVTISSFATTGSDRALAAGVTQASNPDRTISSIVRGGSETFTAWWASSHFNAFKSTGEYYLNPATSAADVVFTLSGNASGMAWVCAVSGVDAAGATATQTGNTADIACAVSSETDAICVTAIGYDSDINAIDSPGTNREFQESGTNNDHKMGTYPGAATVTAGWDVSHNSGDDYAVGIGEFEPAAAGGGAASTLTILGAGK